MAFDPTQQDVNREIEQSMDLFQRAKVGDVEPIARRQPARLLLVVDGSGQDATAIAIASRWKRRFDCPAWVLDAREQPAGNELAEAAAEQLPAEPLERRRGDSFQQILEAIDQQSADLVILSCPYGRELETVGPDSAGTTLDVLANRSPIPLAVVRQPFEPPADPFDRVRLLLTQQAAGAAQTAQWALGLAAPQGTVEFWLMVERGFYEEVHELMRHIQPDMDITQEDLGSALVGSYARTYRALQKGAHQAGLQCTLQIEQEGVANPLHWDSQARHPLVVLPVVQNDHASHRQAVDYVRQSPNMLLVVPHRRSSVPDPSSLD